MFNEENQRNIIYGIIIRSSLIFTYNKRLREKQRERNIQAMNLTSSMR